MMKFLSSKLFGATCTLLFLTEGSQSVELSWERESDFVALRADGETVWKHVHRSSEGKPYFHPLATIQGSVLTDLRPEDHPWHRALWFSWKFINGVNYWEEDRKTGESAGKTEIRSVEVRTGADFSADISMTIGYHEDGQPDVLTETRVLTISPPDKAGSYTIDWHSQFTAQRDLVLDRTPIPSEPEGKSFGGYAGLSFRSSSARSETWSFLNNEGRQDGLHGRESSWVAFSGPTEKGEEAVVSILNSPLNDNQSMVKYYVATRMSYLSPAVLFDGPRSIQSGETFALRYRIRVDSQSPGTERLKARNDSYRDTIELVAQGEALSHRFGCLECHSVDKAGEAGKIGPGWYGLIGQKGKEREVQANTGDGGPATRRRVAIDEQYIKAAILDPLQHLVLQESGEMKGQPFPAIMPPYPHLEGQSIDAIIAYLKTLNDLPERGPTQIYAPKEKSKEGGEPSHVVEVFDSPRIQRVALEGLSTRSISVGLPGGKNYVFDPATFSVSRVWFGGFIDNGYERHARGNGFNKILGEAINTEGGLLPLSSLGPVDLHYKDYPNSNEFRKEAFKKEMAEEKPYPKRGLEGAPRFGGYQVLPKKEPTFFFEIDGVRYRQSLAFPSANIIRYHFETEGATGPVRFQVDETALRAVEFSAGELAEGVLSIPASEAQSFTLTFELQTS
ncbi:DUF6807 family protein [Roseibacillus persicicus]|nr:DUF6807 family protein [Roseibacillus persicicus]